MLRADSGFHVANATHDRFACQCRASVARKPLSDAWKHETFSRQKGEAVADTDLYPSAPHRRTWPPLTFPLVWLFVFAGVWIAGQAVRLVGLNVSAASGRWQDNVAALFASLPVLLLLWLWLRFYEGRGLDGVGLTRPVWKQFWGGMLTGFVLVAIVVAAGVGLGGFDITGLGAWYDHHTPTWFFAVTLVLTGTVVQAMVTEALFRGWILSSFVSQWSGFLAVAANVVACLLIQGGPGALRSPEAMLGILNIALMSWYLCLRAFRDGSLWGVCGVHAAWYLTMGLGLGLRTDGGQLSVTPALLRMESFYEAPWWLTGGDYGPNASLLFTVAAVGLILWRLKGGKPAKRQKVAASYRYDDEIIDH